MYTGDAGNIVMECLQTRGYSTKDVKFPFWQAFQLKDINRGGVI